jgi:hypothetical protein
MKTMFELNENKVSLQNFRFYIVMVRLMFMLLRFSSIHKMFCVMGEPQFLESGSCIFRNPKCLKRGQHGLTRWLKN